ncbi:MAG: hypothetical protein IPO60_11090 [Flavobacteriales bacterium]|nr:hypothetical protein [Flavobacteriales bacterium]
MKTTIALFACMTMAFAANAQWTNFPDPPLAICTAANEQNAVKVVSDGADGWYVLWLDGRVSNSKDEVYGQHLNADGVALWEADGRQLRCSHLVPARPCCGPVERQRIWRRYAARARTGQRRVRHLDG